MSKPSITALQCSSCRDAKSKCTLIVTCVRCISERRPCQFCDPFKRIITAFASRKKWKRRAPSEEVLREVIAECNSRRGDRHEALIEDDALLYQPCVCCALEDEPCEIVVQCQRCVGRQTQCWPNEVLQRFLRFVVKHSTMPPVKALIGPMIQEPASFPLPDHTTDQVFRIIDDRPVERPSDNLGSIAPTPGPVFDRGPFASMHSETGSLGIRSVDPLEELIRSWTRPTPFQQGHVDSYDGVRVSQSSAAPSDFIWDGWTFPSATPQCSDEHSGYDTSTRTGSSMSWEVISPQFR